jgi:hypothetical protein
MRVKLMWRTWKIKMLKARRDWVDIRRCRRDESPRQENNCEQKQRERVESHAK